MDGQPREVLVRHLERLFARIPAAIAVGLLGACDGRAAPSFAEPVHLSEGDSAYVISAVDARLGGLGDERVVFGSILDVDRTASGWVVMDGLANHIVLLDGDLNPLGITGQAGEGPGEFQAAQQLSVLGDTLAVYDWGTGRVSYLAPNGDFLRISQPCPVGGIATTFASHPESGIVFTTAVGEHYLLRASEDDRWPVAPIPADFRLGTKGRGSFTSNLVAVTQDGTVHVLDGRHLAIVSYSPDDPAASIAFLPRELREENLKELTAAENATWQYELMGVQIVTKVDSLADGSLFLSVRHGTAVGYVVDTASLTATPIVIGDDWRGLRERNAKYFDGRRLVLDGGMTPELVLATTELVPRSIAEGAERPERGRLPGAGGPS